MGALMRAWDWSQTPLGAVADWPPALRIAVGTVLGSPQPLCLFWGPDFLALYNDSYRRLIGDKHPASLGTPSRQAFAELWPLAGPLLNGVLTTQTPISREDQPVAFARQGFLEETFFTFFCSPLRDEQGRAVGLWCLATETTHQVLATRRSRLLRELSLRTASARDAAQVLRAVGEVLATGDLDVPFALLHHRHGPVSGPAARLVLRAGLGPDAPSPSPWPVAEVLASREARLVEGLGAGEGVRAGPWPEPVRRALLLPLSLDGGEAPDAVLGVGLSPRLSLDEAYRDFLQLLVRQLSVDLMRIRAEATHLRLSNLLQNAPAFVCTLRGPEHVFELVNPLYRQLMGPGRPFLGLTVREAVPETVEQGLLAQLDAVYRSGQPFFGRDFHALVDRHGTGQLEELFVNFVYQPRRDVHGQVEGIDVFGFEVTDQVLARQRAESLAFLLRESEARQRRVVEASDAGLWELYLVSGRIALDERAAALLGLVSSASMTLVEALAYAHAEDRERLTRAIFAALSGEREGHFFEVFRTLAREGVPARWLECRGQRFQDVDGRPAALAGALLDITPRKQAELERERLLQEAEALAGQLRESEARLRRVVDASGVGLWELDGTSGRVTADARVMELLLAFPGGAPALPVGATMDLTSGLEFIHPEDRESSAHAMSRALAGENEGRYHAVFRVGGQTGGPARWVESRAQRLLSADGQRATLAGVLLDVTERKLVELFRVRQGRLHALSARVGLALARGTTVRDILQECTEALVGQLKAALVRIWLYEPARDELILAASDGLSTDLEGPHARVRMGVGKVGHIARERRPHMTQSLQTDASVGDPEWVRREKLTAFAGYPMLVGDKLVGVLALLAFQDLPEDTLELLRQVADVLALGVERLRAEEALRTRVDFEQKLVGIVSHDLRNPLNAILLGTTVLSQNEVLDARATKSLLRIQSAAERATRMVKDLLDFTQARLGGGLQLTPHPANLHELTRAVVEEVEAAHPTRHLDVRHEGSGQGTFDVDRLSQVVQNLVTNALKYSPEDSRVAILTRGDGEGVLLSVSNGGPPIAADKLTGIFEPMQRATAEVDKVGRSVGLGLYIVKSIVQAHGGSVSVVSTPAEGTVFTVRLPRQPP